MGLWWGRLHKLNYAVAVFAAMHIWQYYLRILNLMLRSVHWLCFCLYMQCIHSVLVHLRRIFLTEEVDRYQQMRPALAIFGSALYPGLMGLLLGWRLLTAVQKRIANGARDKKQK